MGHVFFEAHPEKHEITEKTKKRRRKNGKLEKYGF